MRHANDEPTNTDHLQLIIRQKWTILQAILVVMAVAAVFLFRATPVYRASATLLAKTDTPQMSAREEMPLVSQALRLDGGRPVETQRRLVKSRPVVSKALRKLGDTTPVDKVMKRVTVSTFKDMDVIEVAVEDTDSKAAAKLANEIAGSYISLSQFAARESASTAKDFVRSQLDNVRDDLAAAENRLRAFKRSNHITNLPTEVKSDIEAMANLRASAEDVEADITPTKARVEELSRMLTSQSERQIGSMVTERNPLVDKIAGEVADLEARQAGLLAEVTEENPAAKNLYARIAAARQKLQTEANRVLKTEDSQINPVHQSLFESLCMAKAESLVVEKKAQNLRKLLEVRDRELNSLPDDELQLARLERDVMTSERLFASLTQKYEEFRLAEAMRLASARLVEPAVAPMQPVKPRKMLTLSFALMMGVILGLALASLKDHFDDSISSEHEISRTAGIVTLATVPEVGKDVPSLAMSWSSQSLAAEAYRVLRANLRFSMVDSDIRTLLVTSSLPGEGKSTVSLNLAAAVAAEGRKVVLVEADLRRPTLEDKALIKSNMGLTEILVEQRDVDEALIPSNVKGLSLITSGQIPPNPSELLASNRMKQLLSELSKRFDLVVIDSPPLCPLADAAILSSIADATVLITSIGVSRRGALEHALALLENSRARVIGTVINRVSRGSGRYRRGYYYNYGYYGHNGRNHKDHDDHPSAKAAA